MSERVYLDADEAYPVYSLSVSNPHSYRQPADVPDGFTARWQAASDEWEACQEIMSEAFKSRP